MKNTKDLSKLGYREIDKLADLLKKYANNEWEDDNFMSDGVNWEYNPMSDVIYLIDDDYNIAMLNENDKLEKWNSCFNCGQEGFKRDLPIDDNGNCKDCKNK